MSDAADDESVISVTFSISDYSEEDDEEHDYEDFEEEVENHDEVDDKELVQEDENEGDEGDPNVSRCAICFSTKVALVNLPCCGGTIEESSTTRFCRDCIIKTLKKGHRRRLCPKTLVGECPRCRNLITVYDSSKTGSPIQDASLEQRVQYMKKHHSRYSPLIFFMIAHIHSQYIPIQLIKLPCLALGDGDRQQAILQETLRLLIKWKVLESTTTSSRTKGDDSTSDTSKTIIYRIVATPDRQGRLSSLASQEMIYAFTTAPANRLAFPGLCGCHGDVDAWTKQAWDLVCEALMAISRKTFSDGHYVVSVRLANQALICLAKSFGLFPSLYQSPILGVLSATCVGLGLVCAVIGGMAYSLVRCVAWWSRTSQQTKNQVLLRLGSHTVFFGLGMPLTLQLTGTMVKFSIEQGLTWMFPKIPPRLVNLGSKVMGLGLVLWFFDVSKIGGSLPSLVSRSVGAIVGWEL